MKTTLIVILFTGLALTVLPSFFVAFGLLEFETHKTIMIAGTALWFASAPLWMKKARSG